MNPETRKALSRMASDTAKSRANHGLSWLKPSQVSKPCTCKPPTGEFVHPECTAVQMVARHLLKTRTRIFQFLFQLSWIVTNRSQALIDWGLGIVCW
jgi:hypothetical protein